MNPRMLTLVIAAFIVPSMMTGTSTQTFADVAGANRSDGYRQMLLAYGPGNGDCHEDGRRVECPKDEDSAQEGADESDYSDDEEATDEAAEDEDELV
jgi:hypothetical protein